MKKLIKTINLIILILFVALAPFVSIGIIFGFAGDTSKYYLLIAIGYLGIIAASITTIFKQKAFMFIIVPAILLITGIAFDHIFWNKHNDNLCQELQSNPSCVEDECGFSCSNFKGYGVGFHTGGSICKDKDMSLCREKRKAAHNK